MSDLKKLRELAGRTGFTKVELTDSSSDLWLCYATEPDTSSGEFIAEFASKADANYFAAANPETVIALIDELEAARKLAQYYAVHWDNCPKQKALDVECTCGVEALLEKVTHE